MAMAGLMKVQQQSYVTKRKPYGLMILLAFGAAFLGVLALHTARERRVFDLLVKDKDSELTSLYLLLQKERDIGREAKWKLEEMRTKVDSFRAQKWGLDSRIMEMQSTISSLREEQRAIQLALDKKQYQMKLMEEASSHGPISQTKSRVNLPVKVPSVRTDDPTKSRVNLPVKVPSVSTDDPSSANLDSLIATVGEREISMGMHEPNKSEAEKDSTVFAREDSGSLQQKKFQMQDAENSNKEGLVSTDEIHDKVTKTVEDGLPNAEGVGSKESRTSYEGGLKLEMPNHRQIGRNSADVHSYVRKSKRKRSNKIHKTRKNREDSIRNGIAATSEGTIQTEVSKNQYLSSSITNNAGSEDHKSKTVDEHPQSNSPEQEISEQGVVDVKGQKDLDMRNIETRNEESKEISQLQWLGEDAQRSSKGKPTRAGMSVEKSEIVYDTSNGSEVQNSHENIPRNTASNALGEMLSKINQQNSLEHQSHANSVQQHKQRLDIHHKEVSEQADPDSHGEE